MDDGEVETSDRDLFPNLNISSNFEGSNSADTFLDEFLTNSSTCTHTHTCNPPGPDAAHTHTCYHTHTQVLLENHDGAKNQENSIPRPRRRRPAGNREAVRKYRKKKKAHTAYLEEEVKKLRLLNQQLGRKLQGQAILEAELLRLRSIFLVLRGKIDGEMGAFPFQKQCNTTTTIFKEGDCDLQSPIPASGLRCQTDLPCFCPPVGTSSQTIIGASGNTMVLSDGNCQPAVIDGRENTYEMASAEVQNSTNSRNGVIFDNTG